MMYMERNIRRFWMKLRQGRSETGGEESQYISFFPSPAVDTGNERKNSMQGNLPPKVGQKVMYLPGLALIGTVFF